MILQNIIEESKHTILENDENSGITGLFIGGTIKAEDRTKNSDIDYIGIVNSDFRDNDERRINEMLRQNSQASGIEVKLRVLYESELAGDEQRGFISKLIPIRLWIKRLPHFVHIWGKMFNAAKTIGPYSNTEEAKIQIGIIRGYIARWRNDTDSFHFDWIPKAVLYLCSVESEGEYGHEYTISFHELKDYYADIKDHIIHTSLFQREFFRKTNNEEKECYVSNVEEYLIEIEKKSENWK